VDGGVFCRAQHWYRTGDGFSDWRPRHSATKHRSSRDCGAKQVPRPLGLADYRVAEHHHDVHLVILGHTHGQRHQSGTAGTARSRSTAAKSHRSGQDHVTRPGLFSAVSTFGCFSVSFQGTATRVSTTPPTTPPTAGGPMLQRLKNRIVDLVRLLWRELAKFGV